MTALPGYKDYGEGVKWAPCLPSHWSAAALKWLARIYAGGTPDRSNPDYWQGGTVPWLNSGSVNDGVITQPSELITEEALANSSARWVPSGSVVIALAGQGKTKGTPARLEIPSTTNQSMAAIVPGQGIDHRFIYYWLASNYQSIRNLAGGDLRDGLNLQHIGSIEMPLPPPDEQRAIADYLDRETAKIGTLISEQEGLVQVLQERRIAVISRAVTTGLDRAARLVDSGADWLGAVPEHWDVKRLKFSVASTQVGVWGAEPVGDDDDVLCVRVADFDRPRLRVSDEIPTVRSVKASDRLPRLLHPNDLLLEKSGGTAINPVGFVGVFEGTARPAVSSNFLTRLRVARGQHPRYWLYAHAASYSTRLTARSVNQTTGIQNLDQAAYFDELFPFPPFEEQRAIADYLDDQTKKIDALIAEAEGIVAVAKERRSALITAAVTGQIDVRGEVA
ncbi:MAG: restriction endonuclease subunit S [Actinomycetota bacterium]|nr:MAG: restriction endonuclease subunit S [Actinomycetota bacterium]